MFFISLGSLFQFAAPAYLKDCVNKVTFSLGNTTLRQFVFLVLRRWRSKYISISIDKRGGAMPLLHLNISIAIMTAVINSFFLRMPSRH